MLKVENITYGTKQKEILKGISLQVKQGEFVGVIGPNGSGKSTLLKNIYKMLTPKSGDILLDGKSLVKMSNRQMAERLDNAVLSYVEPYASSTCELVAEILQYVDDDLRISPAEADIMYAGIVVDTNNFVNKTGVRTFEAAAYLRRMGAVTEEVRLLFNSSLEEYTVKSNLVESARLYMGCAVSVSGELPPGMAVAVPQAANDLLTMCSPHTRG